MHLLQEETPEGDILGSLFCSNEAKCEEHLRPVLRPTSFRGPKQRFGARVGSVEHGRL